MNLQKLFEIQAKLDAHIVQEKGLEGQNLLDEKILALQVELGELANEWRGFKFWSENQFPKPPEHNWRPSEDGMNQEWLPEWGYESYPLLEEYVDCLHFILSIGNDIGIDAENSIKQVNEATNWILESRNVRKTPITVQFNFVFGSISYFEHTGESEHYYDVASEFFILGDKFGFTDNQVEQAYLDKNKINHERQIDGY